MRIGRPGQADTGTQHRHYLDPGLYEERRLRHVSSMVTWPHGHYLGLGFRNVPYGST